MGDAQTVGLWSVLATAVTAIGLILKGGYQFVKDLVKTRNGRSHHDATLVQVSNEVAVSMLGELKTDNLRLRDENARLQAQVEDLRVRVAKATDTVHEQGLKIAELMDRIEGLEHPHD